MCAGRCRCRQSPWTLRLLSRALNSQNAITTTARKERSTTDMLLVWSCSHPASCASRSVISHPLSVVLGSTIHRESMRSSLAMKTIFFVSCFSMLHYTPTASAIRQAGLTSGISARFRTGPSTTPTSEDPVEVQTLFRLLNQSPKINGNSNVRLLCCIVRVQNPLDSNSLTVARTTLDGIIGTVRT